MLAAQSCSTLCDPTDCSSSGSSVHRISKARILEWVAIPFSRISPWPRDQTRICCIAGRFFTVSAFLSHGALWQFLEAYRPFLRKLFPNAKNKICRLTRETLYTKMVCCDCLVAKLHTTVCNPMDCSLPGSSIHGISRVRILEWVAIPFSRRSSWPRDWTRVSCLAGRFFTTEPPGKPIKV